VNGRFALPKLTGAAGADGWVEERTAYRVRARPKPKFKTTVEARTLFGPDGSAMALTTRARPPAQDRPGEVVLELHAQISTPSATLHERMSCTWEDGLRAARLVREVGGARKYEIDFLATPFPIPHTTYPEVLLPFLMRGQPLDGQTRAAYAWTSDLFIARVYYEARGAANVKGIATREVWMYPDLNDWIALGGVITKLVKPLIPRYSIWIEEAAPHRVARFEGSFGPPGAPEVVLEIEP
jgi:hypothetical protein